MGQLLGTTDLDRGPSVSDCWPIVGETWNVTQEAYKLKVNSSNARGSETAAGQAPGKADGQGTGTPWVLGSTWGHHKGCWLAS